MSRPQPLGRVLAFALVGVGTCCLSLALGNQQAAPPAERREQASPASAEAAAQMAQAADAFLDALADEQKKQASFELKDEERLNWHFIPRARKGVALKDLAPAQQQLAYALLSTGLSQRGNLAAITIMSLDEVLRQSEQGGRGPVRDPVNYYVSVFGKPEPKGTWGWRVEGHHLSLNFLVVNGQFLAGAPSFFGANPHEVRQGPRAGLRVLDKEEDLGRQLVTMLNDEQRKKAVIAEKAPNDVLLVPGKRVEKLEPVGISVRDLTPEQREVLKRLIETYGRRNRPEMAEEDFRKIRDAGPENITFAWAGSTEKNQPHYYRVQGPTFVIEYDNTQNNANHSHTLWRDPANDFGEDLLKKHYEQHAGDKGHGHDAAATKAQ